MSVDAEARGLSPDVGNYLLFALCSLYWLARVPFAQGHGFGDVKALLHCVQQALQGVSCWWCRSTALCENEWQQGKW
ncbi:hypothetical protein D3C77_604970 [compost metagenome]